MESGRLLLLLPWRAADHTLCAGRKAGGVRAPAPMPANDGKTAFRSDHGGTRDVKDLTINPFEAADGGEGAWRCVGGDEVVQPFKGGTNGGRRPGIG